MRTGERGYALLLAIAVVAVLSLAILASARALGDASTSVTRLQERRDEAIRAESVMSRVGFFMLTSESDGRALRIGGDVRWEEGAALMLDGSWYAVNGAQGALIGVQDEAGLFNVNATDQQGLAALLALGGLRDDAPALAAALMDYTDADDVSRDGGAERDDYLRANMAPPADDLLLSPWQALEAMGWSGRQLEGSAIWDWLAAGPADTGLNVNTAPSAVLEAVLGDRRRAQALISRRDGSTLTDMAEVEALTAGAARADGVTFVVAPARGFRVRAVFGSQVAWHGIERRLELGGSDAARPFRWVEEREVRLAPLRNGETVNSLTLDAAAP